MMTMMINHRQDDEEDEKILKSRFENLFHCFYVFLFLVAHSVCCLVLLVELSFSLVLFELLVFN